MSKTHVFNLTPAQINKLKDHFEQKGVTISARPYMHFFVQADRMTAQCYTSGKLVIQGKGSDEFIEMVLEPEILESFSFGYEDTLVDPTARIGSDEAGKGDYFGPLVVAGVYADKPLIEKLIKMGVKDSKTMKDDKIKKLASEIKQLCPHNVLVLNPSKYNELYAKFKHLNKLLAWCHAKVIENIHRETDCNNIIVDQFAREEVLSSFTNHLNLNLTQRTKAESDVVVAAASMLARADFVRKLDLLSERYQIKLPKGATHVIDSGKAFVSKHGTGELTHVAKIHFKTTLALS